MHNKTASISTRQSMEKYRIGLLTLIHSAFLHVVGNLPESAFRCKFFAIVNKNVIFLAIIFSLIESITTVQNLGVPPF